MHSHWHRREFLKLGGLGLGSMALQSLLGGRAMADGLHHAPRVKRVIQLFMAGAPSQLELFEPKATLQELDGQAPPPSLIQGKRFAFIDPARSKLMGSKRAFQRHGECGAPVSELLPHTADIVDKLCFLRGVSTNEINHGPAKLFMNTGFGQFGRPSMGSWIDYGIGSEALDLPGYVVLRSGSRGPRGGAPLWGNGFLSPRHAGTPFRTGPDPVLHLSTPAGIEADEQREFFKTVNALNAERAEELEDETILARMAAYEMAAKMQTSTPELIDLTREPESVRKLYGVTGEGPSFARNCLLARRLVQRGVRFVQLYHADWDHHGDANNNLGKPLEDRCQEVDRASAALVLDLEQQGLLEDTLVIWGGEFGRTPMSEVRVAVGRDHHIDAFTMWLAGGGVKPGHSHGVTDEIGYSVVDQGVHVHDLHATILHLLGIDHLRLTARFQGRDFRLTDVSGEVVHDILR
ncbi:MAG: hypothetical protein ACI9F9_002559 [Candidatus Paceibacteria bacterium]|jgi:hypothetical protein